MKSNRLPLFDVHTHLGVDLHFYIQGHYPYSLDWRTLLHFGKPHGIEKFFVFPTVGNLSFNLQKVREGKLETAGALESVPFAFENRRMMVEIYNYFPETSAAAVPFWILDPTRKCKEQIEAMRELRKKYPCAGLKVQPTMIQSPVLDLLSVGGVFLDLAEEWNVPMIIHTSIHPEDTWSQCRDILKVVKSRPAVRFCLAHSCRFDRPSLDEVASLSNAWLDCSAHRIHCKLATQNNPSVAEIKNRFPSDYRNSAQVLADLSNAYPEKMMWGSDAPYDSYVDESIQLCSTYEGEASDLLALDRRLIEKIAHHNPLRFLGKTI